MGCPVMERPWLGALGNRVGALDPAPSQGAGPAARVAGGGGCCSCRWLLVVFMRLQVYNLYNLYNFYNFYNLYNFDIRCIVVGRRIHGHGVQRAAPGVPTFPHEGVRATRQGGGRSG